MFAQYQLSDFIHLELCRRKHQPVQSWSPSALEGGYSKGHFFMEWFDSGLLLLITISLGTAWSIPELTSNFVRKRPAPWESPSKDAGGDVESVPIQTLIALGSSGCPTAGVTCWEHPLPEAASAHSWDRARAARLWRELFANRPYSKVRGARAVCCGGGIII